MSEISQEQRDKLTADRFVTYKWLIATTISMLAVIIIVISSLASIISNNMSGKVNMELYTSQHQALCTDLDEIKKATDDHKKSMTAMSTNLLLLMRALKIEPVK